MTMKYSKDETWKIGVQKDWTRLQVEDHLRKFGFALSFLDDRQTVAESLIVCIIQHSFRCYFSLSRINDAIELVLKKENEQIKLRLRLLQKQYTPNTSTVPFIQEVLSLLPPSLLDKLVNFTVFPDNGLVKITLKEGEDLFLWMEKTKGLFSCVTQYKNMFDGVEDRTLAVLRNLHLIHDLLFHHLDKKGDEEVEKAALDLTDKLQECKTPADYLAVMNQQCNIVEVTR